MPASIDTGVTNNIGVGVAGVNIGCNDYDDDDKNDIIITTSAKEKKKTNMGKYCDDDNGGCCHTSSSSYSVTTTTALCCCRRCSSRRYKCSSSLWNASSSSSSSSPSSSLIFHLILLIQVVVMLSCSSSKVVILEVSAFSTKNNNKFHPRSYFWNQHVGQLQSLSLSSLPSSSLSSLWWTPPMSSSLSSLQKLKMAGGEGGETEWSKALRESEGEESGSFEREMKMRGLMGFKGGIQNPKLTANKKLLNWLEEQGNVYLSDQSTWGTAPHPLAISTETLDEVTNESTGRGLLARRNINEGDELLSIPIKLCFTIQSSRSILGNDVITNGMNEYIAIALQLIYEKFVMNEKSFYKPYLDVLPPIEEVNPTFTWKEEELNLLIGSPVIAATESLKAKLKREYDALFSSKSESDEREQDVENQKNLSILYPNKFPKEAFTFENWEWAFTMLFSRAIRLRSLKDGEALALVPYADLINHSPFSNSYIDARPSSGNDWLFGEEEEEIVLYADRGYRKMEQVYISYGQKSNADLLLLYGFALERNPFNSVDVTVSIQPRQKRKLTTNKPSSKSNGNDEEKDKDEDEEEEEEEEIYFDPLANEKLEFLEQAGRSNTVDFPCYADRYPIEMLEYLRLMMMTNADTNGKELSKFDYTRTISAANEANVLHSIVRAIQYQLSKYPNSEEEDVKLIQDKQMFRLFTINQRMAIRHRRNEKRLLKRTIAALQRQIKTRGLDVENIEEELRRAGGSTLGEILPGDEKTWYGDKREKKTAMENRLEQMGLPIDLR